MTKTELKKLIYLDRLIESKLRQLEFLKSKMTCVKSLDYSKDRVQSPPVNVIENLIVKIVDLENEINEDIDRLIDEKRVAKRAIASLGYPQQEVLEMRYLEMLRWEEIANRLNYSIRAVYKIHEQALKELKFYEVGKRVQ